MRDGFRKQAMPDAPASGRAVSADPVWPSSNAFSRPADPQSGQAARRGWGRLLIGGVVVVLALAGWTALSPAGLQRMAVGAEDAMPAPPQLIGGLSADSRMAMPPDDVAPLAAGASEAPEVERYAVLGQGDSLANLLRRAGVGSGEIRRVEAMVTPAVRLDALAPGTAVSLRLGPRASLTEQRPLESLVFRAAIDREIAIRRVGGALTMLLQPVAADAGLIRLRGRVGSNLYQSALAAGVPAPAIQSYLQLLAGRPAIGGLRAGDEFDLVLTQRRLPSGKRAPGELIYAGLLREGLPRLQMLPWDVDGQIQWLDPSGVAHQQRSLVAPVQGRVTSAYGARRHPIFGFVRMHSGVDLGAAYGAPIYAVQDGVAEYAGYRGGYGRYVRLRHSGDVATGYAHMSRLAVSEGQTIRQGQVIGYVGSTGFATGPHLHYEVYRNGIAVNPQGQQFQQRTVLAPAERAALHARLGELTRLPLAPAH